MVSLPARFWSSLSGSLGFTTTSTVATYWFSRRETIPIEAIKAASPSHTNILVCPRSTRAASRRSMGIPLEVTSAARSRGIHHDPLLRFPRPIDGDLDLVLRAKHGGARARRLAPVAHRFRAVSSEMLSVEAYRLDPGDLPEVVHRLGGIGGAAADPEDEQPPLAGAGVDQQIDD